MAFSIRRERFEQLAEEALRALPEEFRLRFENISIIVEDRPTKEDTRSTGAPADQLLGLFRGVAYPDRGGFFDIPPPLPNEIILFQKNIERICFTEEELVEEIRLTLVHEVGHYFGMSEEDLAEYE